MCYFIVVMKKLFLCISLILLSVNVSFAQMEKQKTKIADDIRNVMNEQTAAWNRGDIEGFMQGYWNSPKLAFLSGANVTKGWQPTLDRYKKNYDSRAGLEEGLQKTIDWWKQSRFANMTAESVK